MRCYPAPGVAQKRGFNVVGCIKRGWVSTGIVDAWNDDHLADDRRFESFFDGYCLEPYRASAAYLQREWSPDSNPDDPGFSEFLPDIDG